MAIFGQGVTPNPQNKVSSCQLVYILQPWTPDSPLDRFINTDFGNIVHEGRYRRDFAIVDNVAIDVGATKVDETSTKQGEFLSACIHFAKCNHVLIPLDRFIHTDFGKIICDGRYGRIPLSSCSLELLLIASFVCEMTTALTVL
jgi:hypothetical protein